MAATVRAGTQTAAAAAPVVSALTTQHHDRAKRGTALSRTKPRSSSIPTETKNAALKMICSGSASARTSVLAPALADEQAGKEGAQRDARAGQRGQVDDTEADGNDREQEDLGQTGSGHRVQQRGHHPTGDPEDGDDDADGGQDRSASKAEPLSPSPAP